jgi:hypothetical protein
MATPPYTVTLRSGAVVLAKLYNGEVIAMAFANRTQAEKSASSFGGWVWQPGRPFYVRFDK